MSLRNVEIIILKWVITKVLDFEYLRSTSRYYLELSRNPILSHPFIKLLFFKYVIIAR